MKKWIVLITIILGLVSQVFAGDSDFMISRMWERHEIAIRQVLLCFKRNCSPPEYKEPLLKLVSAETNLFSYGVSPTDSRLVSKMASDLASVADFPAFAYRLFKKRQYSLTGFMPDPEGSFKGMTFEIIPEDGPVSNPVTVQFR